MTPNPKYKIGDKCVPIPSELLTKDGKEQWVCIKFDKLKQEKGAMYIKIKAINERGHYVYEIHDKMGRKLDDCYKCCHDGNLKPFEPFSEEEVKELKSGLARIGKPRITN